MSGAWVKVVVPSSLLQTLSRECRVSTYVSICVCLDMDMDVWLCVVVQ